MKGRVKISRAQRAAPCEGGEIVSIAVRVGDPPLELLGRRHRAVAAREMGEIADFDIEVGRCSELADGLRLLVTARLRRRPPMDAEWVPRVAQLAEVAVFTRWASASSMSRPGIIDPGRKRNWRAIDTSSSTDSPKGVTKRPHP